MADRPEVETSRDVRLDPEIALRPHDPRCGHHSHAPCSCLVAEVEELRDREVHHLATITKLTNEAERLRAAISAHLAATNETATFDCGDHSGMSWEDSSRVEDADDALYAAAELSRG